MKVYGNTGTIYRSIVKLSHAFLDQIIPMRPVLPTDPDNRHRNTPVDLIILPRFSPSRASDRSKPNLDRVIYARVICERCTGKTRIMSFGFLRGFSADRFASRSIANVLITTTMLLTGRIGRVFRQCNFSTILFSPIDKASLFFHWTNE